MEEWENVIFYEKKKTLLYGLHFTGSQVGMAEKPKPMGTRTRLINNSAIENQHL